MPETRNPMNSRPRVAADDGRTMEESIRRAFLTHMGEQQRQFVVEPIAVRRAAHPGGDRELAKKARQQQHAGSHEAAGSDRHGGTRAGAENVEPKRR